MIQMFGFSLVVCYLHRQPDSFKFINPPMQCVLTLSKIGMTTSGGGYRSLLVGAGVVQGLNDRDSNGSTSGLYQALTYHAALSGGSWLLSSLAGNNYPTVTYLIEKLWRKTLEDGILRSNIFKGSEDYFKIAKGILAKDKQGFPPTVTDVWGRLLSFQLLEGPAGGEAKTLFSITSFSRFGDAEAPYSIITSVSTDTASGQCLPGLNGINYEFTPYEFGSWDSEVSAFTQMRYLGSSLANGVPLPNRDALENMIIMAISSAHHRHSSTKSSSTLNLRLRIRKHLQDG